MDDQPLAARLGALRDQIALLEARIADLETQAMQDRRQIYAALHQLQELQRQHNAAARDALAEEPA